MIKLKVIKLNQYFGGPSVYRIIDISKRGVEMYHIKNKFNSRKEANDFVKRYMRKN